jgi:uncharacterized protein (DUF4213/DUF364 family)
MLIKMKKCSFIEKIVERITNSNEIVGVAMISNQAIAVKDVCHEFNIYFSEKDYEWHTDAIDDLIEVENVKILVGVGCSPLPKDYKGALDTAKRWLNPLNESAQWYEKPVEIKLR